MHISIMTDRDPISLYKNKFISDPRNIDEDRFGLNASERKTRLRNYVDNKRKDAAPRDGRILTDHEYKVHPVVTDDGEKKKLQPRANLKEKRVVLSINSNQRNYVRMDELNKPDTYREYMTTENYELFKELYDIAKNINSNSHIKTYQQYILDEGGQDLDMDVNTTLNNLAGESQCRKIVRQLLQNSRDVNSIPEVEDINQGLVNLLASSAINSLSSGSGYDNIVHTLNTFVMSGLTHNPRSFWKPFYYTGSIANGNPSVKQIIYREQTPSKYTMTLPRIIKNVKSVRLLSTEIPNTVNNITERNNIITIQLRKKATAGINNDKPVPVILKDTSIFNFILVKLDVGNYTMDSLISHMQKQINHAVQTMTQKQYGAVFKISWNRDTGEVNITCQRPELEFHLKFYSELNNEVQIESGQRIKKDGITINYSHDLWHMLGFPWPYEINDEGTDKYTSILNNLVNYGTHEVFKSNHLDNDIFNRTEENITEITSLTNTAHPLVTTQRVYKYPQLTTGYIYLVIKGLKSIEHINQFNGVTSFSSGDFFAKVLMDGDGSHSNNDQSQGQLLHNTFVSNPVIFTNAIDKLELLDIEWVDERGQRVDFNQADHSFTLEIIHYINQLDVNAYNTGLGMIDEKSYPDYLR